VFIFLGLCDTMLSFSLSSQNLQVCSVALGWVKDREVEIYFHSCSRWCSHYCQRIFFIQHWRILLIRYFAVLNVVVI